MNTLDSDLARDFTSPNSKLTIRAYLSITPFVAGADRYMRAFYSDDIKNADSDFSRAFVNIDVLPGKPLPNTISNFDGDKALLKRAEVYQKYCGHGVSATSRVYDAYSNSRGDDLADEGSLLNSAHFRSASILNILHFSSVIGLSSFERDMYEAMFPHGGALGSKGAERCVAGEGRHSIASYDPSVLEWVVDNCSFESATLLAMLSSHVPYLLGSKVKEIDTHRYDSISQPHSFALCLIEELTGKVGLFGRVVEEHGSLFLSDPEESVCNTITAVAAFMAALCGEEYIVNALRRTSVPRETLLEAVNEVNNASFIRTGNYDGVTEREARLILGSWVRAEGARGQFMLDMLVRLYQYLKDNYPAQSKVLLDKNPGGGSLVEFCDVVVHVLHSYAKSGGAELDYDPEGYSEKDSVIRALYDTYGFSSLSILQTGLGIAPLVAGICLTRDDYGMDSLPLNLFLSVIFSPPND